MSLVFRNVLTGHEQILVGEDRSLDWLVDFARDSVCGDEIWLIYDSAGSVVVRSL